MKSSWPSIMMEFFGRSTSVERPRQGPLWPDLRPEGSCKKHLRVVARPLLDITNTGEEG